MMKILLLIIGLFFLNNLAFAQSDSINTVRDIIVNEDVMVNDVEENIIIDDAIVNIDKNSYVEVDQEVDQSIMIKTKDPLKASLYSAVIPGLGQLYNGRYIKAPIALGLIGTGIAFIRYYDKRYNRYHRAYLAHLSGKEHEFSDIKGITKESLARSQDSEKRYRDYAIALTLIVYLLNIVDATVDAHLSIFKTDADLAIKPVLIQDYAMNKPIFQNQKLGVGFSISF